MADLRDLSVIVPIAPGDRSWTELIEDLQTLPFESEILFVSPEMQADAARLIQTRLLTGGRKVRWISAPRGRGVQLNAGARAANRPILWFLHADSRFTRGTLGGLDRALDQSVERLLYFNLEFLADGPGLVRLNALGAWVRSHGFGMPFGDQGFCISKKNFEELGRFAEDAPYGEDHLFVWKARQAGVSVRCTGSSLKTSARRYREHGWTKTTLTHGWLTWKQAAPEWGKLIRARISRGRR